MGNRLTFHPNAFTNSEKIKITGKFKKIAKATAGVAVCVLATPSCALLKYISKNRGQDGKCFLA